jgi:hypothetical protein
MDEKILNEIARSEYGVNFADIEDEDIYQYILEKAERYKKGKLRKFEVLVRSCEPTKRTRTARIETLARNPVEAVEKVKARHKDKQVVRVREA